MLGTIKNQIVKVSLLTILILSVGAPLAYAYILDQQQNVAVNRWNIGANYPTAQGFTADRNGLDDPDAYLSDCGITREHATIDVQILTTAPGFSLNFTRNIEVAAGTVAWRSINKAPPLPTVA